jgi:hypothetical protein
MRTMLRLIRASKSRPSDDDWDVFDSSISGVMSGVTTSFNLAHMPGAAIVA